MSREKALNIKMITIKFSLNGYRTEICMSLKFCQEILKMKTWCWQLKDKRNYLLLR